MYCYLYSEKNSDIQLPINGFLSCYTKLFQVQFSYSHHDVACSDCKPKQTIQRGGTLTLHVLNMTNIEMEKHVQSFSKQNDEDRPRRSLGNLFPLISKLTNRRVVWYEWKSEFPRV